MGYTGVLAIDSDTPTLPTAFLQQAIELIASPDAVDIVLGPSDDGGYYLIGMRALHRELFVDMAWSTSSVLPETVRRAEALGLKIAWLPMWFDIDMPEDLQRLRTTLAQTEGVEPQQTRQFFLERRYKRSGPEGQQHFVPLKLDSHNAVCSCQVPLNLMPDWFRQPRTPSRAGPARSDAC